MKGSPVSENDRVIRERQSELERRNLATRVRDGLDLESPISHRVRDAIEDVRNRRLNQADDAPSGLEARSRGFLTSRSPSPATSHRGEGEQLERFRGEGSFDSNPRKPAGRSAVRPFNSSTADAPDSTCRWCDEDESHVTKADLELLFREVGKCQVCSERRNVLINELRPLLFEEEGDSNKVRTLQQIIDKGAHEIAHLTAVLEMEIGARERAWHQENRPSIGHGILRENRHNIEKAKVFQKEYLRLLNQRQARDQSPDVAILRGPMAGNQADFRWREVTIMDSRERAPARRRRSNEANQDASVVREGRNSLDPPRLHGERQAPAERSRAGRDLHSALSRGNELLHDSDDPRGYF